MWKLLVTICFFFLPGKPIHAQAPADVVGKWIIYEIVSDRIYKNFENDSVHLFTDEDKDAYESEEVKKIMEDGFNMFSKLVIIFKTDNTFSFDFMGDIEKGTYQFDPARSQLTITNANTTHSDTLRITSAGLLEYDMSEDDEKKVFTFKRKSKLQY